MSHITNMAVHSLSAFIVWRRVVAALTSITAVNFRLQSSREISGPEVGVLKTCVTTNPLCLRKRWVISSVPVIVSKCRHMWLSSSSVAVSVAGVGDHDFPLFAISCIHKHLRSASSQPGCYTVLYFYSLTTSTSFSFNLSCCQQMLYIFKLKIMCLIYRSSYVFRHHTSIHWR